MSLRIGTVRARPVDLPLRRPIETAGGRLTTAPLVLVDITTDEGVTGCAYASVYTPVVLGPLAELIANLAPLLVGHDAAPEAVERTLQAHFRLLGLPGLVAVALATIDTALWDARARSLDRPLAALIDPDHRRLVPAYVSVAAMAPGPAAEEAASARERGFTAIKVKVGGGELADDLATVRAVRKAIGPDAELMVDYNQSLSVEEAIRRVGALAGEGLTWVEEPTRADDHASHARVTAATTVDVQLGENWWGIHDMEHSVAAGASAHVMFDAMRIGGVSGWLRAARLAQAAELPVSSHVFPEVSRHLLAVTPTAYRLEYVDKLAPIVTEPVEVRDGQVVVPDRPGTGLTWDEAAIAAVVSR